MASPPDESGFILSKCLVLIQKTRGRLAQVDEDAFPTPSSTDALALLDRAVGFLRQPELLHQVSPEALYNRLFKLHELVEMLEASTSDNVSWPLVSYCDRIWGDFFGDDGPRVFYTLTRRHNYSLTSFSDEVARTIRDIVPQRLADEVAGGHPLYALQLASLEETNLPLYANIMHEFGHALFKTRRGSVGPLFLDSFRPSVSPIVEALAAEDRSLAPRRWRRASHALTAFAQELFADLFAGLRVGPAFFLSLYEMSWGTNQHLWSVRLSPRDESIQAYPSSRFRLDCLREATGLDAFEAGAAAAFRGLKALSARDMASFAGSLSTDHEDDVVEVYPPSSEDHTVLRAVLQDHLTLIKECCLSFLGSCRGYLHDEYGQRFGRVDPRAVAELLRRLENDIVPNVVPDGTLLGTPADFQTILNASALFRLSMLRGASAQSDSASVGERIRRVERLTEKALEVSYVQHAYRQWLDGGGER